MLELTVQEHDLEQIQTQSAVLVDRETNLNTAIQSTNTINQILKDRVTELDLRTAEITHLSRMGQMLQSCQNEAEAREVIKQLIPELFPGKRGAVYLINASRNYVEAVVEWGENWDSQKERIFSLSDCWALRRGQLHLMQEGVTEVPCPHVIASNNAEYPNLCVPLLAQSEAQGILYLNTGDQSIKLSEPTILLAQAVSETLSLAFANMRLRESLKRQSIRDPLTGLFNRRYFEETFERELLRAARNHSTVGVIVMDVDHFKFFNDEFGHQAGDAVLFEFGKAFSTNTRASDFACRMGGEEFVLILPDTNLEISETLANNLREKIASLRVLYHGNMLPQVTISMGVTAYPENGSDIETLMRKADGALYQAKQAGRNRVMVAKD